MLKYLNRGIRACQASEGPKSEPQCHKKKKKKYEDIKEKTKQFHEVFSELKRIKADTREIAQWSKYLPSKHKNLGSNLGTARLPGPR